MVCPATQRNEPEDMNPRDQLHTFNSRTIKKKKKLYIETNWLINSCSCCCRRRRCCWWVQYFVCPCRSQRPKCCHWCIGLSPEIRTFSSNTLGYMPHARLSEQWQMIHAECREGTAEIPLFRMMIAPNLLFSHFAIRSTKVYIHCQYSEGTLWMSAGLPVVLSDIFHDFLSSFFPTH